MTIHPLDLVLSPRRGGGFFVSNSSLGRRPRPLTEAGLVELALDLIQYGHLGVAVYEVDDERYEVRINGDDVLGEIRWDDDDGSFVAEYGLKGVIGFATVGEAARRIVERSYFDSLTVGSLVDRAVEQEG